MTSRRSLFIGLWACISIAFLLVQPALAGGTEPGPPIFSQSPSSVPAGTAVRFRIQINDVPRDCVVESVTISGTTCLEVGQTIEVTHGGGTAGTNDVSIAWSVYVLWYLNAYFLDSPRETKNLTATRSQQITIKFKCKDHELITTSAYEVTGLRQGDNNQTLKKDKTEEDLDVYADCIDRLEASIDQTEDALVELGEQLEAAKESKDKQLEEAKKAEIKNMEEDLRALKAELEVTEHNSHQLERIAGKAK